MGQLGKLQEGWEYIILISVDTVEQKAQAIKKEKNKVK